MDIPYMTFSILSAAVVIPLTWFFDSLTLSRMRTERETGPGPAIDWRDIRWWELDGIPERLAPILAELEENETFLARLRNCQTEADLKNLVSVQWSGLSAEERMDLHFLMDGKRDREDWIERTVQHQCDLLSSLLEITEEVVLWRRQNTTKQTGEGRSNGGKNL